MEMIFYDEPDPRGRLTRWPRSIFLAGPTARGVQRTAWRAEALAWLERQGFDGAVVIPEFEARPFDEAAPLAFGAPPSPVRGMSARSHNILAWETAGIEGVGVALFWMPFTIGHIDDPASLPGFTTRAEVSREVARDPSRVVLGMPRGSLSGSHIRYHAAAAGLTVHATLEATLQAALDHLSRRKEAP